MLSGRDLCDGPTARPEESGVLGCDLETSTTSSLRPTTAVEP